VRVAAQATMGSVTRTVSSDPMKGSIIHVEVPTTVNGVLSFANGGPSKSTAPNMLVPDPNFFGGEPMLTERDGDWTPLDISAHPFGKPNRYTSAGAHVADYRIVGLLDMAAAVRDKPAAPRQRQTGYARAGGAVRVRAIFRRGAPHHD
jgi:hypothetical protein